MAMKWLGLLAFMFLVACGGGAPDLQETAAPAQPRPTEVAATDDPAPSNSLTSDDAQTEPTASSAQPNLPLPAGGGWVTFALPDGEGAHLYRLALAPDAVPEDITALLDRAAPGQYSEWLNISPDGSWYILSTDRFDPDCDGWPCLVITQDFATYEVVKPGGAVVHAGYSAIANDGNLIVYTAGEGTHEQDLWAIRRENGAWQAAQELTSSSPFSYHQPPGLAADSTSVVFGCGDDPYTSSALCEAAPDGSRFTVRFRATDNGRDAFLFHPRYAPDGAIVFEGEWHGEQLWRLPAGSQTPTLLSGQSNDNSPCVLPNGLIVSLWLQRPGNDAGYHEIKLMAADGSQYTMLWTGQDVFDIGTGCGGG